MNGDRYDTSTTDTLYFGVRRYLVEDLKVNFGHERYNCVREHRSLIMRELKTNGKGNLDGRTETLEVGEVKSIWDTRTAGPHSPWGLLYSLGLIFMLMGRRGESELRNCKWGDVRVVVRNGVQFLEKVKERWCKSRNGSKPKTLRMGQSKFIALPDSTRCPVNMYLEMARRRPGNMKHDDSDVFIFPKKGACRDPRVRCEEDGEWFTDRPIGKNTISKFVKQMCRYAGIDTTGRKIANSSVRNYLVGCLRENGISDKVIQSYTTHESVLSLNNYDHITTTKAAQVTGHLFSSTVQYDPHCSPPPVGISQELEPSHHGPRDQSGDFNLHTDALLESSDEDDVSARMRLNGRKGKERRVRSSRSV